MRASQREYKLTGQPEYPEFVRLRAQQMLRDNKALTRAARHEVQGLLAWAKAQEIQVLPMTRILYKESI